MNFFFVVVVFIRDFTWKRWEWGKFWKIFFIKMTRYRVFLTLNIFLSLNWKKKSKFQNCKSFVSRNPQKISIFHKITTSKLHILPNSSSTSQTFLFPHFSIWKKFSCFVLIWDLKYEQRKKDLRTRKEIYCKVFRSSYALLWYMKYYCDLAHIWDKGTEKKLPFQT